MTAPDGIDAIKALYGNPDAFRAPQAQLIWAHRILAPVRVPFPITYIGEPVTHFWVHRKLLSEFAAVLKDIADAGLAGLVTEYAGVYSFRAKRTNPNVFSVHTWAAAIDLNATANPLGSAGTDEQRELAGVFKARGWQWGGDFSGIKQPDHFQFASGY